MRARNQNKSNITLDSKMENKTKITDKGFSWLLGVENETEYESTPQEGTVVAEIERPTIKQK